ncbi:MAG: methyltransferase domain-containing protein [archaeon]
MNSREKIKGRLSKVYSGKEAENYERDRTKTSQLNLIYCREREIIGNLVEKERGKFLDVACGTGRFFDLYNGEVYGIDSSRDMIIQAEQKKIALKLKVCDAEKITFPDNTFDVSLSTRFIQHIPQYENVIREMVRVTKPNGKIIIDFPNKNSLSYLPTQIRIKTGKAVYYNFFTLKDIERIAKKFNLGIEKTEYSFVISPRVFPAFLFVIPIMINKIGFLLNRFGYVRYAKFIKRKNPFKNRI